MTRIEIGRPRHLSSEEVAEQVNLWSLGGETINDFTAVTIASYWQSTFSIGLPFAELASTGSVETADLLSAIESVKIGLRVRDRAAWLEICALRAWVELQSASYEKGDAQ